MGSGSEAIGANRCNGTVAGDTGSDMNGGGVALGGVLVSLDVGHTHTSCKM